VKATPFLAAGLLLVASACSGAADATPPGSDAVSGSVSHRAEEEGSTARLLFVGDLMLGRRVAPVAEADPQGLFADVERVLRDADLTFANLESPLTGRPHTSPNPYALEADPAVARIISAAGIDVLGIANNHAGDAGPASVLDTIEAVSDAGMTVVGGGQNIDAAWEPVLVDVSGLTIAVLAFDISGHGLAADNGPGVASWDPVRAEMAVREADSSADIVIAGIHGGLEFWQDVDPILEPVAYDLGAWGADIVWGHGPHVAQPVSIAGDHGARTTVIATSLGNFLFDQQSEETSHGSILEVLIDADGVVAWRTGSKHHDDLRVHFAGWDLPHGNAGLVDGDWWSLARVPPLHAIERTTTGFPFGDALAGSAGDLTGSGSDEILVSYRHPLSDVDWDPRPLAGDASGRSAHIGVFTPDWTPVWMSRRPPHPVGTLAACDQSAAFAYTTIDEPAVVATGAGVWNGFGFTLAADLAGPGTPSCADIDLDGQLDPVIVDRAAGS
jgi:poly-gamma-glutamate capsule biosynthesis protein CapA/YwtB (metallophosphatase superfamily)